MTAASNNTLQILIAEIHELAQIKRSLGFIAFGVVFCVKSFILQLITRPN